MKRILGTIGLLALLVGSAPAAEVPRPAPAVSYPTTTGTNINLANYKGKVVCLQFLLTTCSHCQTTSGILQRMYQQYGPKGFQVLGVATNDNAASLVPNYIRSLGLSFPVGYTSREKAHEFLQLPLMMIMYVPQLVFIDRQGVIRAQYGGASEPFFLDRENNIRKQIESMLGIKSSSAKK
jgi:peroxiredoxin